MITLNSIKRQIVRDSSNLNQPNFNLVFLWPKSIHSQTFLPTSFNLVIHQKLTPLNISAIATVYETYQSAWNRYRYFSFLIVSIFFYLVCVNVWVCVFVWVRVSEEVKEFRIHTLVKALLLVIHTSYLCYKSVQKHGLYNMHYLYMF